MYNSYSTLCFSGAETLRCAGLTRQQAFHIFIPALIEGILGLALLYFKFGKGKKYWLFVAEGILYAVLAGLDYYAHTHASGVSALSLFKTIDIVIGALSTIALVFYALFLYLFAKGNLLPLLSRSWSLLVSRALLIAIPIMLVVTTIASFVGISYTPVVLPDGNVTLGVGFLTSAALTPWTFMSYTSLAILTAYQATYFCLAFLRFFHRGYRADRASLDPDIGRHSLRGTWFLAAGLKIGAIETAVGFAGFSFTPSLVRRILRAAGRAFLLVGVWLSRDEEDRDSTGFTMFGGDAQRPSMFNFQRSKASKGKDLRAMISKPQANTFRHVGSETPDMVQVGSGRRSSQRVTVHFDAAKTPRLEMRFSDFLVPVPTPDRSSATSSDLADYTGYAPPVPLIQAPPAARRRGNTIATIRSLDSELETVMQFTPHFPRTPTTLRETPVRSQTLPDVSEMSEAVEGGQLQRKWSKRKPAPIPSPTTLSAASTPFSFQMPVSRLRVRTDSTVLVPPTGRDSSLMASPYLPDDGMMDYEPSTPSSGRSRTSSSLFTMPPVSSGLRSTTPGETPRTATLAERRNMLGRIAMRAFAIEAEDAPTPKPPHSAASGPTIILSADGEDGMFRRETGFRVLTEEPDDMPLRASDASHNSFLPGGRKRSKPEVPLSVSYDADAAASIGVPWSPDARSAVPKLDPAPKPAVLRVKAVNATRPALRHTPQQASLSAEAALGPFADPSDAGEEERDGADLLRMDSVDSGVLSAVDRAHIRASLIRVQGRARERGASPFDG